MAILPFLFALPLSLSLPSVEIVHLPQQLADSSPGPDRIPFTIEFDLRNSSDVLNETLQNIASYLHSTLFVLGNDSAPLRVIVEFGSEWGIAPYSTLGLTASPPPIRRPPEGRLIVPASVVPSAPQSFHSWEDRSFFELLLRFVFALMGLHESFVPFWPGPAQDDWDSGAPRIINETLPRYNRQFRWLATPRVHELIGKRFGLENLTEESEFWPFQNDHYGAELAWCDGSSCQLYWSDRVFYTEIMAEQYWGYARISRLTFAALEDTGWYEVNAANESLFEALEWGDYRSLGLSAPLRNFSVGQPDFGDNWPSHYIVRDAHGISDPQGCTYDHRAIGQLFAERRGSCNEKNSLYCLWRDFTDSQNLGYYEAAAGKGNRSPSDFALVRRPGLRCGGAKPEGGTDYSRFGSFFGENEYQQNSYCAVTTLVRDDYEPDEREHPSCYSMACDSKHKLFIFVNQEEGQCRTPGELLEFKGYSGYVVCPAPNVICGIERYGEPSLAPETEESAPAPTPEITAAGEGFSLFVFYTLSYVETYFLIGIIYTETVAAEPVDVRTQIDGVWRWTKVAGTAISGSVSIFSRGWSLSQISWIQAIHSTPFEGRFGINSAGWVGIILSAVMLVAFMVGIILCSRRADKAWQAEQKKFAEQHRKAQSQRAPKSQRTRA